jgi:hypothetical protein
VNGANNFIGQTDDGLSVGVYFPLVDTKPIGTIGMGHMSGAILNGQLVGNNAVFVFDGNNPVFIEGIGSKGFPVYGNANDATGLTVQKAKSQQKSEGKCQYEKNEYQILLCNISLKKTFHVKTNPV